MPPKPPKPAGFGKKAANKEWGKKVQFYGAVALFAAVCVAMFLYAEYEQGQDRHWAATYERKCEACQTIVTSGILTRSMCRPTAPLSPPTLATHQCSRGPQDLPAGEEAPVRGTRRGKPTPITPSPSFGNAGNRSEHSLYCCSHRDASNASSSDISHYRPCAEAGCGMAGP